MSTQNTPFYDKTILNTYKSFIDQSSHRKIYTWNFYSNNKYIAYASFIDEMFPCRSLDESWHNLVATTGTLQNQPVNLYKIVNICKYAPSYSISTILNREYEGIFWYHS